RPLLEWLRRAFFVHIRSILLRINARAREEDKARRGARLEKPPSALQGAIVKNRSRVAVPAPGSPADHRRVAFRPDRALLGPCKVKECRLEPLSIQLVQALGAGRRGGDFHSRSQKQRADTRSKVACSKDQGLRVSLG